MSACGCPGAFLESWCDETSTIHKKLGWAAESESNCVGSSGAWCTGAANDDTESSGIGILYIK